MKKVTLNEVKGLKGNTRWHRLKNDKDEPNYSIDTPEIKQHQLNEMKRVKPK